MVTTVADFLLELKNKEQELLKKYEIIKHPGLIGDMYEGLTKSILEKSIFDGLNIHIRSGKIKNSKNQLSQEIDCMIVVGDGEPIPYTDKHIYDSNKVIAVIQVKKNLLSKGLVESFENLRSVTRITELKTSEPYYFRLFRDTWRKLFKEELPSIESLKLLSMQKQMIYHLLLLDICYPVRIAWGYNGYKSEYSLRKAFAEYIEGNITNDLTMPVRGFDPLNFPNLIICDKYTLMKGNGVPFVHPISSDGWWLFYTSSNENPLYYLLQIIWTRLSYMFDISSDIFGDNDRVDEVHGFLQCRFKKIGEIGGWEYKCVNASNEELLKPLTHTEWEPCYLTRMQYIVINKLCSNGSIDLNTDKDIFSLISTETDLDLFLSSLKETGLIDITNNVIKLITIKCVTGITKSGKYFAADDSAGHVTNWIRRKSL